MVVDGQVDVLPADAIGVDLPVAGNAMTGLAEAGQLLDVQVQQLAGPGVFVAVLGGGRLQLRQPLQAGAAPQAGDHARRHGQFLGDLAVGLTCASLCRHLLSNGARRGVRTVVGPGRAIGQTVAPFLTEALEPLVGRAHADVGSMGRLFHPQTLHEDAIDEQGATTRA